MLHDARPALAVSRLPSNLPRPDRGGDAERAGFVVPDDGRRWRGKQSRATASKGSDASGDALARNRRGLSFTAAH
jgi:hypothetical protein